MNNERFLGQAFGIMRKNTFSEVVTLVLASYDNTGLPYSNAESPKVASEDIGAQLRRLLLVF